MKQTTKWLALLLALIMVFSLAACGPKDADDKKTTNEETKDAPAGENTEDEPSGEADVSGLPDPVYEGKYPDPSTPVELTIFADYTWLEFSELTGIVPQYIEEQTGVKLKMIKATDGEQLNLLLSGDELPDMISTGGTSKKYLLSNDKVSYSYTDLIAKYCPDWEIPEVEQKVNARFSEDGKFYFLMNNFNTTDQLKDAKKMGLNYGQFHMRKDIYEAIGSPEMHTADDLFDVLKKVKEEYPDMIPMVLNTRQTNAFAQLVGYDPGMPKDTDGNICFPTSDPLYKDFMKMINRCFREGLMIEENFSYDSDEQINQFISSGQAFMTTFYAGNDEQVFTAMIQASIPEASFVQVPLFDKWSYTFDVTGWSALTISKDCKHPEAAIKLIRWAKDHQLECMLGVPDEDFILNDDGTVQNGERMVKALEDGTVETVFNPMTFVLTSADYITESQARFYSSATPDTQKIQDQALERATYSNIVGLTYPPGDSDEGVIQSKLYDLLDEYIPLLGTAADDEEFDTVYEQLLEAAEAEGVETLNQYYRDQYTKYSELFGAE